MGVTDKAHAIYVYVSTNLQINYFRNIIMVFLKPYSKNMCYFLRIGPDMLLKSFTKSTVGIGETLSCDI